MYKLSWSTCSFSKKCPQTTSLRGFDALWHFCLTIGITTRGCIRTNDRLYPFSDAGSLLQTQLTNIFYHMHKRSCSNDITQKSLAIWPELARTVHISVHESDSWMCRSALLWLVYVYGSLMMSSKIIPPPLHWLSSSDWETGGMRGCNQSRIFSSDERTREETRVFVTLWSRRWWKMWDREIM